MPYACHPDEVSTLSPLWKPGWRESITSPTVWPVITSPICTGFTYDLASLILPRMYGSSESHSLRTSTSPSPGVAMGVSTMRKFCGVTAPVGRLSSRTCRLTAMTLSRVKWDAPRNGRLGAARENNRGGRSMLRRWLLLPAFVVSLLSWSPAWAQSSWPPKPIRWVVPYTPGGITDSVTRLVTHELEQRLGQNIVVENRPGANSIVGAEMVARSAPDGYTIVTVIAAHAANATLYAGKLNFDAV